MSITGSQTRAIQLAARLAREVMEEAASFGECTHQATVKLSSIQKQKCADCGAMLDWPLKPNQPPLVTSSRDKRK